MKRFICENGKSKIIEIGIDSPSSDFSASSIRKIKVSARWVVHQ